MDYIDSDIYICQYHGMDKIKRISANLPAQLLEETTKITRKGITETLIAGLKLLQRSQAYEKAKPLKGKLHLDLDLDASRERSHR